MHASPGASSDRLAVPLSGPAKALTHIREQLERSLEREPDTGFFAAVAISINAPPPPDRDSPDWTHERLSINGFGQLEFYSKGLGRLTFRADNSARFGAGFSITSVLFYPPGTSKAQVSRVWEILEALGRRLNDFHSIAGKASAIRADDIAIALLAILAGSLQGDPGGFSFAHPQRHDPTIPAEFDSSSQEAEDRQEPFEYQVVGSSLPYRKVEWHELEAILAGNPTTWSGTIWHCFSDDVRRVAIEYLGSDTNPSNPLETTNSPPDEGGKLRAIATDNRIDSDSDVIDRDLWEKQVAAFASEIPPHAYAQLAVLPLTIEKLRNYKPGHSCLTTGKLTKYLIQQGINEKSTCVVPGLLQKLRRAKIVRAGGYGPGSKGYQPTFLPLGQS